MRSWMVRRMYENLSKVGLDLEGLPGYGVGGAALNILGMLG